MMLTASAPRAEYFLLPFRPSDCQMLHKAQVRALPVASCVCVFHTYVALLLLFQCFPALFSLINWIQEQNSSDNSKAISGGCSLLTTGKNFVQMEGECGGRRSLGRSVCTTFWPISSADGINRRGGRSSLLMNSLRPRQIESPYSLCSSIVERSVRR